MITNQSNTARAGCSAPEKAAATNDGNALDYNTIRRRLNDERMLEWNITPHTILRTKPVNPIDLFTTDHFDLFAKYVYARFWAKRLATNWALEIYDRLVFAFNGYEEGDGSGKHGLSGFVEAFHRVLESIEKDGFSPSQSIVPVTTSNFVIDGGHRVAACLHYKKEITALEVDTPAPRWDWRFFKQRGMPTKHMDFVGLEFCELKQNARIAISSAGPNDQLIQIRETLERSGSIFYEKEVHLNNRGARNLFCQIVENEAEFGGDQIRENQDATSRLFSRGGSFRMWIFETDSGNSNPNHSLLDHPGVGESSIYVTNNQKQSIRLGQMLLNRNSIEFLCSAFLPAPSLLNERIESHSHQLSSQGLNPEDWCLAGKSVLAVYGLQTVGELEVVCLEQPGLSVAANRESKVGGFTRDDLIFNPSNHFYYRGVKVITPQVLKRSWVSNSNTRHLRNLVARTIFLSSFTSFKIHFQSLRSFSGWLREVRERCFSRYVLFKCKASIKRRCAFLK